MGLIGQVATMIFGRNRNAVKEIAEVFRPNAEAAAVREAELRADALRQFSTEFVQPKKGWFDSFMDGVNRVPRPAMALGTLGLISMAMIDPVWFAARMQGLALVPEPLWWLMGAIVGFYFGARAQAKDAELSASLAASVARAGEVTRNIEALDDLAARREARALAEADRDTAPLPEAADPAPDAPVDGFEAERAQAPAAGAEAAAADFEVAGPEGARPEVAGPEAAPSARIDPRTIAAIDDSDNAALADWRRSLG